MQSLLSQHQKSQDSGSLASSCTLWPVDLKLTHLDWNPEDTLIHFQGQYLTVCDLDYNILQDEVQNTAKTKLVVDIGEFCLVEDVTSSLWYRGRVQGRKADACDVFLIDHGNVLSVDVDRVSSCSKDLFILPPKIVCGFLANVLLLQSVPPPVFEDYFSSLIGRKVTGYVQALLPHKVLLLEAPDVNNDLVRHGFGRHVDTETFLLLVEMLTEVPLKQNIEPVPDLLIEKPVGQEICFKPTNLHRYKDILSFCRRRLSCGTRAAMRVTAAINPRLFYCQMVGTKTDLSEMSKALAAVCDDGAKGYRRKTQENVGLLCSVKSKDGEWYRGFVPFLPFNSQVRVLFIDYGFFESVKVENVHRLPPNFYSKPIMAFPCSLSCLDKQDYADQQLSFLKAGLLGRVLDTEICSFDEEQHLYTINLISAKENHVKEPESAQELPKQDVESVFVSADLSLEGGGLYFDKVLGEALCKTVEEEEVQVDSVFVGYVEYVQNPNHFWIRTQKRNEEFEGMMGKMADHFSRVKLDEDVLENPALGSLCCAVHEADKHLYRAVVIDVLEQGAEVLFIDFGNTEKVPHTSIKNIPKAFASKPPFAISCSLDVFPMDEGWTSAASDFFRHTVSNKALSVHVVRKRKNNCVVDLREMGGDGKRSVTDFLISSKEIECWNNAETTSEVNGNTDEWENYDEEENVRKSEIEEARAPVCFKALSIDLGRELAVRCTCINSPTDFWCLPQDNIPALEELMDKVQQHYSTNTVPLQSGFLCCVAKSPMDGRWCRAFIIEKQNGHVKVILIDYGFTVQVEEKELQEIMPEFVCLEGQAFRCCLSNLSEPTDVKDFGDWHLEVCKSMKQFVFDNASVLRCRTVSQLNVKFKGLYNVVDLYNSQTQQTLTNWLVEQGLAREATVSTPESFVYSSHDLSPGREEQVFVTHVGSQWEVFCQLERNTELIEELENRILEESQKVGARAVASKLCLAKYFDGKWYRGVANPVQSPLHLNVFFVDYGNANISEKTHVLSIPRDSADLLYTPVQALRFCLASVSKEELYADAKEWLHGAVLNKQIKAIISRKNEDGSFDVELFDGDVNINEKVKELILSLRPQPKTPVTFVTKTTKAKPKTLNGGNTRLRSQPRGRSWTIKSCRSTPVRNAPPRKSSHTRYYVQNNTKMKQQHKNKSKNSEHRKYQDTNTKPEPQANKTEVPQLARLPEKKLSAGLNAKCFASHIDSVDRFYLHLSEDEPAILQICDDLNSSSFRNSLKAATSLTIDGLVLAEYEEDGALYRSIVTGHEGSLHFVEFVDYGNKALVGKDKISPMPTQYLSQPRFSIACSLFDASQFENDGAFTDAVMERPLLVEFVRHRGTLWQVNVEVLDGEVAVPAATAESSSVNEKEVEAPECSLDVKEEATTCGLEENENEEETFESIACAAQGETNKPKTPTVTFLTKLKRKATRRRIRVRSKSSVNATKRRHRPDRFVTLMIRAKDRENGTVLSVQDDGSFYIRLARTSHLLTTLENHVASSLCECLRMVKDVKLGCRCLVQVNAAKKWHRAVVQHASEEKCHVLLVDHGITEEIPRGSMRQQCGDLTKIPCLAVKCKINGLGFFAEAEESTRDALKSMIGRDVTVAFVRYVEVDDLWMVEVVVDGLFIVGQIKSLPLDEETAASEAEARKEAAEEPSVDAILPRHLAFAPVDADKGHFGFAALVTTPFEFCVILEDSLHVMNKVSIMLDDLPEQTTSPLPEAHIVRGACCLLESDSKNKWCRAEIAHADATVLLHLVDYGPSECLPYEDRDKLKRLPEELLTLPKGTHPCVLRGVRPVGGAERWTNEAAIFFRERLYQGNLQIFFREFVPDSHWKVDVLSDGVHVAKELVEAGHATSTDVMLALRLQKQIHRREEEDDGKSVVSTELAEEAEERRSLGVFAGSTRCVLT